MATFSEFEVTHLKHIRRRGNKVEQLPSIDRATETHFMAQATANTDGHRFGMSVVALQPTETIPPAVIVALQAAAQDWVDENPTDPGDEPNKQEPR